VPSSSCTFAINAAWLSVVMLAVDLIAWAQLLLSHDDLAKAEPQTLRYRLLHVAVRLTHGQRRLWLRIQHSGPGPHPGAAGRPHRSLEQSAELPALGSHGNSCGLENGRSARRRSVHGRLTSAHWFGRWLPRDCRPSAPRSGWASPLLNISTELRPRCAERGSAAATDGVAACCSALLAGHGAPSGHRPSQIWRRYRLRFLVS